MSITFLFLGFKTRAMHRWNRHELEMQNPRFSQRNFEGGRREREFCKKSPPKISDFCPYFEHKKCSKSIVFYGFSKISKRKHILSTRSFDSACFWGQKVYFSIFYLLVFSYNFSLFWQKLLNF